MEKEKNEANEKIKELKEQIENSTNDKQNIENNKESNDNSDYEEKFNKLNSEYIALKVSSMNEIYEKESLLNKYKNLILSISKKYKVQFNI